MSLYARCPHCGEHRAITIDRLPSDVVTEPCEGCEEFDLKLEQTAEADWHDDELYAREHQ